MLPYCTEPVIAPPIAPNFAPGIAPIPPANEPTIAPPAAPPNALPMVFLRNHASYKQHQKLVEFHPKSKLA